jgi:aspartyl-tRNA(Asn)/glutamyl-tRNA(Gln) amidotransferase subunit A
MNMKFHEMSAHELSGLMQNKEVSALDIVSEHYEHIRKVEPQVQSMVSQTEDLAIGRAKEIDALRAKGEELSPLAGIPMGIKDNISTKGVKTTCSSKMLENYVPSYDAHVMEKLNGAGGVMVGKLNMDEFAMGSSNENSRFFPTRNPWNLDCVPGGSSGGPAACVAAGEAVFSLGSDTGGSIRQPASLCGLVGMKPTYGRVSRYGLIAFASSLDQIGPFTRDVEDCALVLENISGYDKRDSTSADVEVPRYRDYLNQDIRGMKIGVPKEYYGEGLDEGTVSLVREAIKKFESLGAEVEEISMPYTKYALPAYYIIAPAECSSNLARFDGVRYGYRDMEAEDVFSMYTRTRAEGFGHEVKKRIMLGTYVLSSGYYDAYYKKAQQVRTLIKQDFDKAFEKYDILLTPTATGPAFKFGEKTEDPLSMYLSDICTVTINLAGVPAVSMPCGFIDGLPIGMQLIGAPFAEGTILKAAHAYERATDFHTKRPVLEVE